MCDNSAMPKATQKHLHVHQGDTWDHLKVTVKDEDNIIQNLTGYTAELQVRLTKDSATKEVDATDGNSQLVITAVSGLIVTDVPAATIAALAVGKHFYDLQITHTSSGKIRTLLQGELWVDEEVTR